MDTTADAICWAVAKRAYIPYWTLIKRFEKAGVNLTTKEKVGEFIIFAVLSLLVGLLWLPVALGRRVFAD